MTVVAAIPTRLRRSSAIHPLLFAAYSVLFLWSQNLGETDPRQVVLPLVVLVGIAALLTLFLGAVYRDRRRGAIVASALVVGLTMYGHAAAIVEPLDVPGFIQQAAWLGLTVIAAIAAWRLDERVIATIDTTLVRIAAVLLVVTAVLIVPFQATALAGGTTTARTQPAADTTSAQKRDVYWLVFDRYGSDRSLKLQYDVDNDMTPWLRERGFTVLADSHANYIRTALSMSSTLNMAPVDDVARAQGPDSPDMSPVNELLQDPLVARQFKALGYRYFHIGSWWDPTRADSGADVSLTLQALPGSSDFVDALFDASALPAVAKRLGLPTDTRGERHYAYTNHGLEALKGLADDPGPKFVLAHILLPHPPLVFDRDGSFMDEAAIEGLSGDERFGRQLEFTNQQVREIVDGLLALPEDEQPIIIFQADEGPWPGSYSAQRRTSTDWAAGATDEELEQKYGIMNAWYLPGGEDLGLYPTMSAINTFPVLFGRYFGIEYPLLPDRIYSSHDWFRPYDLTDITERLPSLR